MRVRVSAHSVMDVPHLARAGIFIPTKGYRYIEVLDQDDDPPKVKNMVRNATTGAMQPLEVPNQDVIGRKTYQRLIADGRFSVVQDSGLDASVTGAEIAAARSEVVRVTGLHADAQVELASLRAQIATVSKERDDAQFRVAELEEQLAAASKKGGRGRAKDAGADEATGASDGTSEGAAAAK